MKKFTISPTIALDTQAKALAAAGHEVINLTAGELDFLAPLAIQQAVSQAALGEMNRYSPVAGQLTARQAVCAYEQQQHGVTYTPEQILITNGAKQALATAFLAVLEPGDEVIILQPAWVSYVEQIKLAGGKPILVETNEHFLPEINTIVQAITPRTKGMVLNYPNNPTGVVYSLQVLQAIAALAQQHGWWVISDEIYEHIIYDGAPFISFATLYPNTVVVNGLSKAAAVTGWRIGYAAGPNTIIQAMIAIQSHLTGNVSNVMQAAIKPGLIAGLSKDWLTELHLRRQYVAQTLGVTPPDGAFYYFIDIRSSDLDSVTFCQRLLQEYHVAVVPGKYFGREGLVRLSFAVPLKQLELALERWKQFYAILPK